MPFLIWQIECKPNVLLVAWWHDGRASNLRCT